MRDTEDIDLFLTTVIKCMAVNTVTLTSISMIVVIEIHKKI